MSRPLRLTLSLAVLALLRGSLAAQPSATTPLIPLPAGWRLAAELMAGFPAQGLQVYALEASPPATPAKVYCLAWDTTAPTVAFKPVLSATPRTPTQFAAQESGTVYAALNGGFFGGNQSFSLVQQAGAVLAANVKSVSRPFQGAATAYFPTRAAFGITAGGRLTTDWVYSIGNANTPVVAYPDPSPNRLGNAPQPVPTLAFPAGGTPWIMEHAIGGSPMLVKDAQVRVTDQEELIDLNNTTPRARSAIGYTAAGIVLLVAAEGDNAPGPAGFSLVQFATLLRSLGCVGAVNLDGGGSTSLVIDGRTTVRPSDGRERPVISALLLVDPSAPSAATAAPLIAHQPWDLPVAAGSRATLHTSATGGGLSYRWSLNGNPIAGATQASHTLPAVTLDAAGLYRVTATNSQGSVTSRPAALSVVPDAPGELANLSTRADSGIGADVLIGGFVLRSGPGTVLARGIGPGLAPLGVTGFLPDPHIELLDGTGLSLAKNDDWNPLQIASAANALGAFSLPEGSRDAALLRSIAPGPHVVVASGTAAQPRGNVLIELYDAAPSGGGVLTNLSARARIPSGDHALIAGFVVRGRAAITLLIRAIGPALQSLGVPEALPSTHLALMRGGETLLTNTRWSASAHALEIREAARQTGAFALAPGSPDSALLVTVAPGAYTAVVRSPVGAGGIALVEVYEVR
jgi:hypothetical protein